MADSWRWSVAYRYTRSGTSDRLVSFMSLVSISGLVLGVAVLVLVLSVMNGFERELRERVLGVLPHGIVFRDGGFADWPSQADWFAEHPQVEAAAPYSEGSGLIVSGDTVAGILFFGIDPERERRVSIIDDFITQGSLDSLESGRFNAALGTELAGQLGVSMGDPITLVLADASLTLAGPLPRMRRFTVTALFEVGADADTGQILMHLDDANKLRRVARVDGIRLKFDDLFVAPEVLSALTRGAGRGDLYATSWMQRYGNLYGAIQVQKSTMFLLLLMLVAVAAFNVVSNLVMTVDDKRSDIAILRTLGATPLAIMRIFMMHGALVGAIGVLLGLVLGVAASIYLTEIYQGVDSVLNLGLMDEYFIHYLPSEVLVSDVVRVAVVSFFICLVATIYPALKAANSRPVEALSHDG